MSLFAATLRVVGLSHQEASEYLSEKLGRPISHQTIMDMSSARSRVRADIWAALRELYALQVRASEEALDQIDELTDEHGRPEEIDLSGYHRSGEWPSQRVADNVRAMVALGSDLPLAD